MVQLILSSSLSLGQLAVQLGIGKSTVARVRQSASWLDKPNLVSRPARGRAVGGTRLGRR